MTDEERQARLLQEVFGEYDTALFLFHHRFAAVPLPPWGRLGGIRDLERQRFWKHTDTVPEWLHADVLWGYA